MTNQLIKFQLDDAQLKYTGKDFNYLLQQLEVEADENYSLKIVNLIKWLAKVADNLDELDPAASQFAADIINMITSYDIDELKNYTETLSELFRHKHQQEVDLVCENYYYSLIDVHSTFRGMKRPIGTVENKLLNLIEQTRSFAEQHGYPIADDLAVEYDYYKKEFESFNQK